MDVKLLSVCFQSSEWYQLKFSQFSLMRSARNIRNDIMVKILFLLFIWKGIERIFKKDKWKWMLLSRLSSCWPCYRGQFIQVHWPMQFVKQDVTQFGWPVYLAQGEWRGSPPEVWEFQRPSWLVMPPREPVWRLVLLLVSHRPCSWSYCVSALPCTSHG